MGGLVRNLIFGKFGRMSNVDANDLKKTGAYYIENNSQNIESYSILIVFEASDNNILQLRIADGGLGLKTRVYYNGKWFKWNDIQIIGS